MADLGIPAWDLTSSTPPNADTTVTFFAHPEENPDGGVRITYTLSHPQMQFVLPSPPAAGAKVVSQTPDRLVEDHEDVKTVPTSITRTLAVKATTPPGLVFLTVAVADMVGVIPVRERR